MTDAITIPGPAHSRRIKWHAIHLKTDIAVMPLLDDCEYRTVTGFQPPVCMTAIKRPRKTIRSVLTEEGITLRLILQPSLYPDLVEVIRRRLNKIAYFLLLRRSQRTQKHSV